MWTFHAMGTEVTVAAPTLAWRDAEALAEEVAAIFVEAEARFSRFRDDSELARINRARDAIVVSRPMIDTLVAARAHVLATDGLFDPTVGGALEAAGYDRSFAPGRLDRPGRPVPSFAARFVDVGLDEVSGTVVRPPHVHLDLGGLVKGRTVDRAAELLPASGFVDAGGDLAVHGGWPIDVEDPADPSRVLLTVVVRDRAVATSAPNRRRWRTGGTWAHHLIDPRTGAPAQSDLAQATAVAATAEDADVLAKTAFLLGADAGADFLVARGAAGVLVAADGTVNLVGDLEVVHA